MSQEFLVPWGNFINPRLVKQKKGEDLMRSPPLSRKEEQDPLGGYHIDIDVIHMYNI